MHVQVFNTLTWRVHMLTHLYTHMHTHASSSPAWGHRLLCCVGAGEARGEASRQKEDGQGRGQEA